MKEDVIIITYGKCVRLKTKKAQVNELCNVEQLTFGSI